MPQLAQLTMFVLLLGKISKIWNVWLGTNIQHTNNTSTSTYKKTTRVHLAYMPLQGATMVPPANLMAWSLHIKKNNHRSTVWLLWKFFRDICNQFPGALQWCQTLQQTQTIKNNSSIAIKNISTRYLLPVKTQQWTASSSAQGVPLTQAVNTAKQFRRLLATNICTHTLLWYKPATIMTKF